MPPGHIQVRRKPHAASLLPGLAAVVLMLIWTVHNGGYDEETWYWGTLASIAIFAATLLILGRNGLRVRKAPVIAIGFLAAYTAWSYLSIAWAQAPGVALAGANKTLLYLLLFSLLVLLPWTPASALVALLTLAIGIGVIGIVLLFRLAAHDNVVSLVVEGRLAAPTGYFNATAALFTLGSLTALLLATRRELPGILRGALVAFACSGLQLAIIVQSRGWLFTLPLVVIVAIWIAPDRLRLAVTAIIPLAGAGAPIRSLLDVYQSRGNGSLDHASARAGQAALLICAGVFVLGTLAAWVDGLVRRPSLGRARRRFIATAVSAATVVVLGVSFVALTHGHPARFISRQWNGFSHPERVFSSTSHFVDVGGPRYDFWRVALDATLAHPVGGLGQDNFADYYLLHRRTSSETSAVHSIELRLLAHTGFVGLLLFTAFLIVALRLAISGRRRSDSLARGAAGAALMPLVVWLIYGSVDWFWEFPALSGPALGFLAIAASLGASESRTVAAPAEAPAVPGDSLGQEGPRARRLPRPVTVMAGAVLLTAAVFVVGVPYLSVREVSLASDVRASNPAAALRDLETAAELDPLDSLPGRLAGTIALENAQYAVAEQRFAQSISHEPDGWFSWLGAGLAASALGRRGQAHADFLHAYRINDQQPADLEALNRVFSRSPLTSAQAFKLLVIIH